MAGLSWRGRLSAVVWLRYTLWRHGLRRRAGADTAVGVMITAAAVAVAAGLAVSLGGLVLRAARSGDAEFLRVAFHIALHTVGFLAVIVPLVVSGGAHAVQVSRLVVFPLSRGTLGVLSLASNAMRGTHLLWYPALIAVTVCGVFLAPINNVLGLALMIVLALLLIVWSHALQLLLETLMRRRTTKDLVVIFAITLLMGASLVPALIDSDVLGSHDRSALLDVLRGIPRPLFTWLPPSLVAEGLVALYRDDAAAALPALAWLAVWLGAGLGLAHVVLSRTLLEGDTTPPARGGPRRARRMSAARHARQSIDLLALLPGTLAAVLAKELRYLVRSTPGKLGLIVAPLLVTMIALAVGKLIFVKQPLFGIEPGRYALIGVLLYAALITANFFVNSFAWEGDGLKAYLMYPVAARHVILGKNLGVLAFQSLLVTECLVVWSLIRSIPQLSAATCGALAFFAAALTLMAAGNFVSIAYPVGRSISSLANSCSQVGTIVSFATIALVALLVGLLLVLGLALGGAAAQVVLLTLLLGALIVVNVALLDRAADLFDDRREQLAAALEGAGDGES